MKTILPLTLLILFLVSCKEKQPSITELKMIKISIDSITEMNTSSFLQNVRIKDIDNQLILYWVDYEKSTIELYNQTNGEKRLLALDSSVVQAIFKKIDYQLLDAEQVGFYSWRHKKFFIQNINTGQTIKYNLDSCLAKGNNHIIPTSISIIPFIYHDNTVAFLCTYDDIVVNNPEAVRKYAARNHTILFYLNDYDACNYFTFGQFPTNYKAGNMYGNEHYQACINSSGQYVFSYAANDSLFVYDAEGCFIGKYEAKSNYSKPFVKYDYDKVSDLSYKRKYTMSNHAYDKVIYDEFRNLYYRFYKKKVSYINEDGKIIKPDAIPWTIIILNDEFEKLYEVEIDDKYSIWSFITTKQGIYIGRSFEDDFNNKELSLTLIQFVNAD